MILKLQVLPSGSVFSLSYLLSPAPLLLRCGSWCGSQYLHSTSQRLQRKAQRPAGGDWPSGWQPFPDTTTCTRYCLLVPVFQPLTYNDQHSPRRLSRFISVSVSSNFEGHEFYLNVRTDVWSLFPRRPPGADRGIHHEALPLSISDDGKVWSYKCSASSHLSYPARIARRHLQPIRCNVLAAVRIHASE